MLENRLHHFPPLPRQIQETYTPQRCYSREVRQGERERERVSRLSSHSTLIQRKPRVLLNPSIMQSVQSHHSPDLNTYLLRTPETYGTNNNQKERGHGIATTDSARNLRRDLGRLGRWGKEGR